MAVPSARNSGFDKIQKFLAGLPGGLHKKGWLKTIERKECRVTLLKSNMELNALKSPDMELCYGLE